MRRWYKLRQKRPLMWWCPRFCSLFSHDAKFGGWLCCGLCDCGVQVLYAQIFQCVLHFTICEYLKNFLTIKIIIIGLFIELVLVVHKMLIVVVASIFVHYQPLFEMTIWFPTHQPKVFVVRQKKHFCGQQILFYFITVLSIGMFRI